MSTRRIGLSRWVAGLVVAVAIWATSPLIAKLLVAQIGADWPILGAAGDSFGAINALFSGAALVGVVVALWLQSRELFLQREELSASARAQLLSSQISLHAALIQHYRWLIEADEQLRWRTLEFESIPPNLLYQIGVSSQEGLNEFQSRLSADLQKHRAKVEGSLSKLGDLVKRAEVEERTASIRASRSAT